MALIDSSSLIQFSKGVKTAITAVKNAEERYGRLGLSTVSVFELAAGKPAGIEQERKALLQTMRILPLTYEHAERGGIIFRVLREKGEEIEPPDAMIAAVALVEGEPLITANARHFQRVAGLQLITH